MVETTGLGAVRAGRPPAAVAAAADARKAAAASTIKYCHPDPVATPDISRSR